MHEDLILDRTFDENDLPVRGEYESCLFNGCDFTNGDLSEFVFIDCRFNNCNFSLAKLNKTSFQNTEFVGCKMLGLRFDHCNKFGLSFSFSGCLLNHASLSEMKIRKTVFKDCQLLETDFTGADLTSALFDNCDLARTVFNQTLLEKADFRTSFNYSIDPELSRIKKAKFSLQGIAGLLGKYDIDIEP